MKLITWQAPDGALAITIPAEPALEGESEAMYLDRIALATQAATPWLAQHVRLADVAADALPGNRRFRGAWRHDGQAVTVDLPLARQQVLAEVRAERNARLVESDADKARLDDLGTAPQKQQLAQYRQALRDLPASVQADLAALKDADALGKYAPIWPAKS